MLYLGLPYRIINYAQESGRAGHKGEAVDLLVVLEKGKVKRRLKREGRSINRLAIAGFI